MAHLFQTMKWRRCQLPAQAGEPDYNEKVVAEEESESEGSMTGDLLGGGNSLYDQAVQLVVREQKASRALFRDI